MTRSLTIPPDGPLLVSDDEPHTVAATLLHTDSLDVVTARALGRDRVYVMYVDDWGTSKGLPLNRRAWALYGGSPLYGTAVLAADDGGPIDDHVLAMVADPDFPPAEVLRVMDAWLEAHS